jgi:hypothetical protein
MQPLDRNLNLAPGCLNWSTLPPGLQAPRGDPKEERSRPAGVTNSLFEVPAGERLEALAGREEGGG